MKTKTNSKVSNIFVAVTVCAAMFSSFSALACVARGGYGCSKEPPNNCCDSSLTCTNAGNGTTQCKSIGIKPLK